MTRGDCAAVPRPCPFEGCRYHNAALAPESCALDVADRGGVTLDVIARNLGFTRQRAEQLEHGALAKIAFRLRRFPDFDDRGDPVEAVQRILLKRHNQTHNTVPNVAQRGPIIERKTK